MKPGMPPPLRNSSRRGATLLVTLGILTLLSVMTVTFLVTARIQRQTTTSQQHRLTARNHIDEGLYLAMRTVEESLSNKKYFKDLHKDDDIRGYQTYHRIVPVNRWFNEDFEFDRWLSQILGNQNENESYAKISKKFTYQTAHILTSPVLEAPPLEAGPRVNLLTPSVMNLIPCALTNEIPLSSQPPLFSGWHSLVEDSGSIEQKLNSNPTRIAFAVFNCSGFFDANYYVSGPSTSKLPRVCFSQADVTNWLSHARVDGSERFTSLEGVFTQEELNASPFFHLSYDPGPDLYPLHYDCFETAKYLGKFAFDSGLTIDLNTPLVNQVLQNTTKLTGDIETIRFTKFNLNSVTNHFRLDTQSTDKAAPWFNDADFKVSWLDTVVYLLNMIRNEEPAATRHRWADSSAIAWSMANFMDKDRIPQISDFPTADAPNTVLATRANYAVEDVPLINKISIFNIYNEDGSGVNDKAPKAPDYYDLPSSGLSNHYAVAVELWYPFAPNEPPIDSACYVGIYTNAEDVITTTNKPWTQNELRDWFKWNNVGSSNTVMQTLFTGWADSYLAEVGLDTTNNPLWQIITYQEDLWFTTNMTAHPYWPKAEADGTVDIKKTPIWQAFFPDTLTNSAGQVIQPLPMNTAQSNSLLSLFAMLPTNSVTELYDYLMLRPEQFDDWDTFSDYYNQNPSVMNTLGPSNEEPTLGYMTEKDRHALWPEGAKAETVILDPNRAENRTSDKFQGVFWTVYPKQTVSFRKVIEEQKDESGNVTQPATTNYYELGDDQLTGKPNTIWVRPAVTILPIRGNEDTSAAPANGEDATSTDVIVDESLLTHVKDKINVGSGTRVDASGPVWGWSIVTNLCIPDPRRNAYAKDWKSFDESWESVINTTNLNTGVSELPFIHFNQPLSSIGDIGHIYASYEPRTATEGGSSLPLDQQRNYDTLTFATRSGAALLDIFTLHPTNAPTRGLVQANTQQRPVIKALLSDVKVGWTNSLASDGEKLLRDIDAKLERWPEVYTDALTNSPYSMGWRSFADMLPDLSTNATLRTKNVWVSGSNLHPMHDYTEDALRGIVDKVSFRQNIFVIIVAAQALSPASTQNRPVVLADQRAAVTVLRDAYTGRWTIHSWTWLTE